MKKDMIIRFMLDAELDARIREYCEENDIIFCSLQCGLVQEIEFLYSYMTIEIVD